MGAFGFAGEPLQEGGGVDDLAFCLGEGFPVLEREDQREIVGVLDAEVGPFAEPSGALARRRFLEALEGGVRGQDGRVGVCRRHFGERGLRFHLLARGLKRVGHDEDKERKVAPPGWRCRSYGLSRAEQNAIEILFRR